MDYLTRFLTENPHIHYATPQSPDFTELCLGFIINATKTPAMIVRPRSAEEVSALVSVLIANDLPFSVRSGGHDMFGRSQIPDGITIDMREIAHVHVDPETQTARVGGGVISMDLLRVLQQHQMTASHPVTPTVGYVGWATYGGYGPLSATYGLGIDQIVGAKVVNAQGEIREADGAMLTAIRGGGGTVGVIVELTIKIYPQDQVLGGLIIYQSEDVRAAIYQYDKRYRQIKAQGKGIPSALNLYHGIIPVPTGVAVAVVCMWASSNLDEGQAWISEIASWSSVAMNTVAPTSIVAFNEANKALLPERLYGSIFSLNVYELTPEVVDVIGIRAPLQPSNPEIMFGIHELRAEAPQKPEGSVFTARRPHFVIEIIPMVAIAGDADAAIAWGQDFYDALLKTDSANIMPSSYISLTPGDKVDMRKIYGSQFETLKTVKEKYDPKNIFKNTLLRL